MLLMFKIKLLNLKCSSQNLFVDSIFYSLVCECFTFFFIKRIFKIWKLKSFLGPCFFIKSCLYSNGCDAISLFRNKWEQKYIVSDTRILYKHWLCKCYKVHEGYIEFCTMQKRYIVKVIKLYRQHVANSIT